MSLSGDAAGRSGVFMAWSDGLRRRRLGASMDSGIAYCPHCGMNANACFRYSPAEEARDASGAFCHISPLTARGGLLMSRCSSNPRRPRHAQTCQTCQTCQTDPAACTCGLYLLSRTLF